MLKGKACLVSVVVLTSLYAWPALAAPLLPDCNPVPGLKAGVETCQPKHLLQLLVNIYNWLLGFAGIVALLMIVWSGIRMLTFYISETPDKDLESAKLTLRRAMSGLVIIICAYLIVNTAIVLIGGGGIQDILNKAGL